LFARLFNFTLVSTAFTGAHGEETGEGQHAAAIQSGRNAMDIESFLP
jgi:hypothetical protein